MPKKPPVFQPPKHVNEEELLEETTNLEVPAELKSRAILLLSGPINETHLGLAHQLLELHYTPNFNEEIQLLINSPGGDTSIGWAIVDVMNYIRLPIHTISLGLVCSMAADIFVNGDRRTMGEHSTLMIHPHSTVNFGNHHQLIAAAKGDTIEHYRRLNHYLNNSKYTTIEQVQKELFSVPGDDLYLTPEECMKHGLCDDIAVSNKGKRRKPYYLQITTAVRNIPTSRDNKRLSNTKSKARKSR